MDQQHYVGLDVSLETTSVCVIDQNGATVWRGKCRTDPKPICRDCPQHAAALFVSALRPASFPTG